MNLIQIFARPPVEGKVKTRLMAGIGAAAATSVYRSCLKTTINLVEKSDYQIEIWLSERGQHEIYDHLNPNLQVGENLGERMFHALSTALQSESTKNRVLLVGTDCVDLNEEHFKDAFQLLDNHDLVFLPAIDGGFAMIGCRRIKSELFSGTSWGTEVVMEQTLNNASSCGLSVALLEPVRDIDTVEDLHHYPDLLKLLEN